VALAADLRLWAIKARLAAYWAADVDVSNALSAFPAKKVPPESGTAQTTRRKNKVKKSVKKVQFRSSPSRDYTTIFRAKLEFPKAICYILCTMDWNEIINLLEQGEGQAVEFEKAVPSADDLARELVAFSNSDGGKIVYGIDDKNKHLIGLEIDGGFSDWVAEVGKMRCHPPITPGVEVVERGDKKIAVVSVPEGDEKAYKTDDICYIRDVNISRPAREDEEEEIKSPWSGKDLNKRQKRALQFITEHGSITNREFREAFGVSHKTAHIELTMMADKKLISPQGLGRSTCYVLPKGGGA